MKSMHILFLTYHLPLDSEPGAFRPWMEARLLSRAGYRVTVVTSGVQYMTGQDIRPYKAWCTEETVDGIRILRTWAPSDHRRSVRRRIYNYLAYTVLAGVISIFKAGRVDRIFAGTDPIFMMPMVYMVSALKRAPMVVDERDLYPETAIALGVMKQGALSDVLFRVMQFFRRRSVGILSATPGIRRQLLRYGVSEDKVCLLYNADVFLDETLRGVRTEKETTNLRRQVPGRQFFVGYVGGLGKANDIPTLLRAAERLKDLKEVGVVIVGAGEMRNQYVAYCREHGLDNVIFIPAVPRQEARALIREMDICVQPLPKGVHFSNTLTSKTFDYHAAGKPMVFCGQGDTETLLEESNGGIAVPSGDDGALGEAIRSLYSDRSRLERMGNSARDWYTRNLGPEASCGLIKQVMASRAC